MTSTRDRFHIVNVLWGQSFTRGFLDIGIPNQLAPGNLPALAQCAQVTYKIYTTPHDQNIILESHAYKRLAAIAQVEVIPAISHIGDNPYAVMSSMHRLAVESARQAQAMLIFICPDHIFSDGAFKKLYELHRAGKQAVLTGAVRLRKTSLLPLLTEKMSGPDILSLSPRQLTGLALRHLHPALDVLWYTKGFVNTWPSVLLWRGQNGILMRAFHLHPLLIHPELCGSLDESLDSSMLQGLRRAPEKVHVIRDSDELAYFEFSEDQKIVGSVRPTNWITFLHTAHFIHSCQSVNRKLLKYKIRLHSDDLTEEWTRVEEQSDRDLRQFLWLSRHPEVLAAADLVRRMLLSVKGLIWTASVAVKKTA